MHQHRQHVGEGLAGACFCDADEVSSLQGRRPHLNLNGRGPLVRLREELVRQPVGERSLLEGGHGFGRRALQDLDVETLSDLLDLRFALRRNIRVFYVKVLGDRDQLELRPITLQLQVATHVVPVRLVLRVAPISTPTASVALLLRIPIVAGALPADGRNGPRAIVPMAPRVDGSGAAAESAATAMVVAAVASVDMGLRAAGVPTVAAPSCGGVVTALPAGLPRVPTSAPSSAAAGVP
mmetsp:Transcript_90974/g.262244  ORF Transcript_90974/g.262244 Transcript_90974/m.262244 type:complete len:238 (-) Transcript_90974:114-827(-)